MLEGYLTLGGVEIANHARLQAYIDNGLVGGWDRLEACGCPTLTAASLGDAAYVSPAADPAPWYDATQPDSGEFAGLLLLGVSGIDDRPQSRTVSQAVTGGGVFNRQRTLPRTMVASGVLLGSSCCGVAYGLRWLGQVLAGCGTPGCDGEDMTVFDCCPSEELAPSAMDEHLRTLRRVALVQGPTVTRRAGEGCEGGCTADVIFVEFVLTAAEPWLWGPLTEVVSEAVPTDDGTACVEWDLVASGCVGVGPCCRLATCHAEGTCHDPDCTVTPSPTVAAPNTCFCIPLATNETCVEIDTSSFGASSDLLPTITVDSGYSDLRRFTVTFYEKDDPLADCCDPVTFDSVADLSRCHPHSVYHVGYLEAATQMVLDGQVRRALIECDDEQVAAADVWGADGSPLAWTPLGCDKTYCVVLSADALFTPADDATVTIELSVRQ